MQTLAKVYEDRADEFSRAAQQIDDPVFCRLLLMLASQWKLAAQGEAKSKDAPTSSASTQPQPQTKVEAATVNPFGTPSDERALQAPNRSQPRPTDISAS